MKRQIGEDLGSTIIFLILFIYLTFVPLGIENLKLIEKIGLLLMYVFFGFLFCRKFGDFFENLK